MNKYYTVIKNHFSIKEFKSKEEAQSYINSKPEVTHKYYYILEREY